MSNGDGSKQPEARLNAWALFTFAAAGLGFLVVLWFADILGKRDSTYREAYKGCKDAAECSKRSLEADIISAYSADLTVDLGLAQAFIGGLGLIGLFFTVLFAYRAWKESEKAAKAAHDTLVHAEKATVMQMRPYITVASAKIENMRNRALRTAIVVKKNTGLTPAINVRSWISVAIRPFPPKAKFEDCSGLVDMGGDIVTPGTNTTARQPLRRMTRTQRLGVECGALAIYTWGAIYYQDMEGREYETHYCLVCCGKDRVTRGRVYALSGYTRMT